MNYRQFGKTALHLSEIGFGAWAIGGNAVVGSTPIGWGAADDATSVRAIHAAVDAGINFFDTADFYGLGHSEKLLGEALKDKRDVITATKVGHKNEAGSFVLDYSKEHIIKGCEESLKRLQRDVIDYYQLHSARIEHLQQGGCIEAMEVLKQQGKIRYWGASLNTFKPEPEANFLMENNIGDGLQLVFNLLNQRAYNTLKRGAQNGYGIIARMPLQFGVLTGKFSAGATFGNDDHRSGRLTPGLLQQMTSFLDEKIWPVAGEEGVSKTALALSFILSCPEVSTVIPGIRTPEHVLQNTTSLHPLSPDHFQYLLALSGGELIPLMEEIEKRG